MRNVSWLIFWGLHRSSLAAIPGRDSLAMLSRRLFHFIGSSFHRQILFMLIDDVAKVTTQGTRSLNKIDDFTRHFWIRRDFFSAEIRKIFTHYCGICGMFCFLVEVTFHMEPNNADLAQKMNRLCARCFVLAEERRAMWTDCERHKTKLVISTADKSAILILLETVVKDLFADLKIISQISVLFPLPSSDSFSIRSR